MQKHSYTNKEVIAKGATNGIFQFGNGSFGGVNSLKTLKLEAADVSTSTDWVDEKIHR